MSEASATSMRQARQRRRDQSLTPPPEAHGLTGYTSWGCRCETCVRVMRWHRMMNARSSRARHKAQAP